MYAFLATFLKTKCFRAYDGKHALLSIKHHITMYCTRPPFALVFALLGILSLSSVESKLRVQTNAYEELIGMNGLGKMRCAGS